MIFPINITLELESEFDLNELFSNLKSKVDVSIRNLNGFLTQKTVNYSHYTIEERNKIKSLIENLLANTAKILDYSEKIDELKSQDSNYITDQAKTQESERYGSQTK